MHEQHIQQAINEQKPMQGMKGIFIDVDTFV